MKTLDLILNFIGTILVLGIFLMVPGMMTMAVLDGMKKRSWRARFLGLLNVWIPFLWIVGIFIWLGPGDYMLFILAGAVICWSAFFYSAKLEF